MTDSRSSDFSFLFDDSDASLLSLWDLPLDNSPDAVVLQQQQPPKVIAGGKALRSRRGATTPTERASISTESESTSASQMLRYREDPDRNARAAKANRERHKMYVNGLEETLMQLKKDLDSLQSDKAQLSARMAAVQEENEKLRETIANQSLIADAMTKLGSVFSLAFDKPSSTLTGAGSKHGAQEADDYHPKRKAPKAQSLVLPLHLSLELPM
jgi:hypothetical protein